MLILHQLHRVDAHLGPEFEATLRDRALPIEGPVRMAWVARSLPDSFGGHEFATMTVIDGAAHLDQLSGSSGPWAEVLGELRSMRRSVENRLCTFMIFSPFRDELLGEEPVPDFIGDDPMLYLHDFVTPQRGTYDEYNREMNSAYRTMLALEQGPSSKVWAALQVLPGGGVARECVIIGRIPDPNRFGRSITAGIPEDLPGPLGDWMRVAKRLRDTWTSRLVRAPSWSPRR